MSYEIYKLLHFVCIFIFIAGMGIGFFASENPKLNKITSGIASLFIFVAGMGLMARLNIPHGQPWPLWIKVKMGVWFILVVGVPMASKRLQKNRGLAFCAFLFLFALSAMMAVYKVGE